MSGVPADLALRRRRKVSRQSRVEEQLHRESPESRSQLRLPESRDRSQLCTGHRKHRRADLHPTPARMGCAESVPVESPAEVDRSAKLLLEWRGSTLGAAPVRFAPSSMQTASLAAVRRLGAV